jgi:hypothetical protein
VKAPQCYCSFMAQPQQYGVSRHLIPIGGDRDEAGALDVDVPRFRDALRAAGL